ncbi:unnamed protein product [Prunus armeniaca]
MSTNVEFWQRVRKFGANVLLLEFLPHFLSQFQLQRHHIRRPWMNVKNISIEYARQVGENIEGGASVTNACCYELVHVDKTCHDLFFNSALSSKPNVDKSRVLTKSAQVWSQCIVITLSPTSFIA